jgi:excisionase family DNA binding protein
LEVEAKEVEEWVAQKKIPAEFESGEWRFNRNTVDKWVHDEKIKL